MNKFGHSLSSTRKSVQVIHSQSTLPFNDDGDYNADNRKLCNLKTPTKKSDGANKNYVDMALKELTDTLNTCLNAHNIAFEKKQKELEALIIENQKKIVNLISANVLTKNEIIKKMNVKKIAALEDKLR